MKYYTEGYEDITTEDELEETYKDMYENYCYSKYQEDREPLSFQGYINEVLDIRCADIDHQDGDFYLKVLRASTLEGEFIEGVSTHCSLESALDGFSCNCDEIYQVRNGRAIYQFGLEPEGYAMNYPYDDLIKGLKEEQPDIEIEEDTIN